MGRARNLWPGHPAGRRRSKPGLPMAGGVPPHSSGKALALRPASGHGTGLRTTACMKPKVLLIEDDPNDVEIFGRILEEEGYEVTSANNVDQGLTLARNEANEKEKEFDVV